MCAEVREGWAVIGVFFQRQGPVRAAKCFPDRCAACRPTDARVPWFLRRSRDEQARVTGRWSARLGDDVVGSDHALIAQAEAAGKIGAVETAGVGHARFADQAVLGGAPDTLDVALH